MMRLRLTCCLLAVVFVTAPVAAHADSIDPAAIGRILDTDVMTPTPEEQAAADKKRWDALAEVETKRLDQTNPDWKPSNPKWPPVYDKVRGDFEKDGPDMLAANKGATAQLTKDYETEIAAGMKQADVDAILAYYDTPEGQRYRAFMHRINAVMSAGAALLTGVAPKQDTLTPEQTQRYIKLLELSQLFQSMAAMAQADAAAHHDISGYDAVGFMVGMAIHKKPEEMEAIDKDYGNDIPAFETFTKTDAARHFFLAMGQAMPKLAQNARLNPITKALGKFEDDHKADWQEFYQTETNEDNQ